ncbi:MAG: SRPBCC domain-containing protein [Planctomycetes bacterium]|nr:SRPBCC domain-containing protein [Planctomycetota bacterium]
MQRDPDGRRSVRVEVEVPGTPEQVWQAIASGPGISAWFVPTQLDGRVGGEAASDFGGGMVSKAVITAWEPPHRFSAEDPGWQQGMPPVATEWTVEAKAGGTCVVRVVHSMFASTDDWDGQLEGTEHGWPGYFLVLRRYLEHFLGQRSAQVQTMAMVQVETPAAWQTLAAAMQLGGGKPGERVAVEVAPGVTIAGTVERVGESGKQHTMLLALEQPAPGTMFAGAFPCGGTMVSLQTFLYGDAAEGIAREAAPKVKAWIDGLFPAPAAS